MIVVNSLDPDQDRFWFQAVCKGYQQITKVAASTKRVIIGYAYAKINKTINGVYETLCPQPFPLYISLDFALSIRDA